MIDRYTVSVSVLRGDPDQIWDIRAAGPRHLGPPVKAVIAELTGFVACVAATDAPSPAALVPIGEPKDELIKSLLDSLSRRIGGELTPAPLTEYRTWAANLGIEWDPTDQIPQMENTP